MRNRSGQSRSAAPLIRAKRAVAGGIRKVADSPWAKFTTGVVLLTSGLDEAIETLFADLSALELGAHHGVILLGFVNVMSSLPDMLDGLVGTFLVDEHDDAPVTLPVASARQTLADHPQPGETAAPDSLRAAS